MQKTVFRIIFFGVFGLLCLAYLHHGYLGVFPDWISSKTLVLITLAMSVTLGEILYQLNKALDKPLSWSKSWPARTFVGIFFNTILSFTIIALVFYEWSGTEGWNVFLDQYTDTGIKLFLILFFYSIIDHSIAFTLFSYNEYAHEQIKKVALENEQIQLQYEALKSQISPHYLFNSLNTIASLIHQDANKGEEFIRKLADTFKYVLKAREYKLVTLEQELEFIKDYTYLLKVRHGEAVQLMVNVSQTLFKHNIPPFSLQILVENALKHNVITGEVPLLIQINSHKNRLLVSNNQTEKPSVVSSFKIGLENIRKRYAFFTEEPVIINSNGDFMVSIPLLYQAKTELK